MPAVYYEKFKDIDGKLGYRSNGGTEKNLEITSITKKDNNQYTAKINETSPDNSKESKDYTFTVKSSNGNCIIDSCTM